MKEVNAVDVMFQNWVGYAILGGLLASLFVAPWLKSWRRQSGILVFSPKITGILGPLALVGLFAALALDSVRHWTGKAGDWIWVGSAVAMFVLFLRAAVPWATYIGANGLQTRNWYGIKKSIAWDEIGGVYRYHTHGMYPSSGCEIVLHGGTSLCWDDHFHDGMALAEVISHRSKISIVSTVK